MSETILDSETINSGGSTATGTCAIGDSQESLLVLITGFDNKSTDLDVELTGVAPTPDGTIRPLHSGPKVTSVDASNSGAAISLAGGWGGGSLAGIVRCEITVTNNAGSNTTVTVEENTA